MVRISLIISVPPMVSYHVAFSEIRGPTRDDDARQRRARASTHASEQASRRARKEPNEHARSRAWLASARRSHVKSCCVALVIGLHIIKLILILFNKISMLARALVLSRQEENRRASKYCIGRTVPSPVN